MDNVRTEWDEHIIGMDAERLVKNLPEEDLEDV